MNSVVSAVCDKKRPFSVEPKPICALLRPIQFGFKRTECTRAVRVNYNEHQTRHELRVLGSLSPGSFDHIAHQHDVGHRPRATWHWRDHACYSLRRFKVHIAAHLTVNKVDSKVNDYCPWFNPVTLDHSRPPNSSAQDIAAAAYSSQVRSERVAHGYRSVLAQK